MWLNIQTKFSAVVTSRTKDTNNTAYVYYPWSVQTGYTAAQVSMLTHGRSLSIDNSITCNVKKDIKQ